MSYCASCPLLVEDFSKTLVENFSKMLVENCERIRVVNCGRIEFCYPVYGLSIRL